jgi:hypothetical protein
MNSKKYYTKVGRCAQINVIAINWCEKAILLGECKWGVDAVGRSVIQRLFEKSSKVVPGSDWQIHYAFFARAGFTAAARQTAEAAGALLADLKRLDTDLLAALNRTGREQYDRIQTMRAAKSINSCHALSWEMARSQG